MVSFIDIDIDIKQCAMSVTMPPKIQLLLFTNQLAAYMHIVGSECKIIKTGKNAYFSRENADLV